MKSQHVLIPFLLITLSIAVVRADVYDWVDEKGIRHFSSSKPTEEAAPSKLPPIMREKSLRARPAPMAAATCIEHGGVHCEAGPDVDGSVLCHDGFAEATARFRFECFTAKLSVSEISPIAPNGSARIYIRNEKGVAADAPKVVVKTAAGDVVEAVGPNQIAANGLEEYLLQGLIPDIDSLPPGSITLTCKNC